MKNFVVYKSSAGSGKTFTLVKEYLRLALMDERRLQWNFKKILAVTFTNKAAAEMKSRVVEMLNSIAYDPQKQVMGTLLAETLNIEYSELKKRAQIVLKSVLHHYSDLSIGTIDSFTHKIVKTFAQDLQLPLNFNVEMDTGSFYEKVIASLFASVGEDDYVSKLLKDFALTKAHDNAAWDPEEQIREFAKLLHKENSGEYIQQLQKYDAAQLEEFRLQFKDFIEYYLKTIKADAKIALDLIAQNQIEDADFIGKSKGPQNFFKKCFAGKVELEDLSKKTLTDVLESQQWQGKGTGVGFSKVAALSPQLTALANQLLEFIQTNSKFYNLSVMLSKQMYPLMLLKKIEELTETQKQEERIVFVSEFNRRIFDIIQNEPTPFIYERLGERYQNFLLDEFQDTSSLQWQNLLPLIDSSLANGWFNLVVGDGKQSIYRWRNANVKQFANLPKVEGSDEHPILKERADALERNFFEDHLRENYRSAKNIVTFNNSFFTALSTQLLNDRFVSIYQFHEQKIISQEEGFVSIELGNVDPPLLQDQTEAAVLAHIHSAKEKGYALKDICILARTNHHGNSIASFLMQNKIPVVSSDSLLLVNSQEINVLVSCLHYLADREDKLHAAAVLQYLHRMGHLPEEALHPALRKISGGMRLGQILGTFKILFDEDQLSILNLSDCCIRIIEILGLEAHGYQYLRFFLDQVGEFLVLNHSNISDFFEWWEIRQNKASMIIPDNTDAVRIMTIHASKGLEFPIVIIPYCNWRTAKSGDGWVQIQNEKTQLPVSVVSLNSKAAASGFDKEFEAEKEEQLLDNLNLLYVAFTRAASQLHIIALKSKGEKQETVSKWIEDFADENLNRQEVGQYTLGAAQVKKEKVEKQKSAIFNLNPLSFNSTQNNIKIKSAYLLSSDEAESARHQGILIHWLLSAVEKPEDLEPALDQGIRNGELKIEDKAELLNKLQRIIHLPQIEKAFRHYTKLHLEKEIVSPNGEVLRPDRFVEFDQEYTLIDYKTGKENYAAHSRQLYNYQDALINMGYQNIRKLIVYIDEEQVVEVN